ncbi:DsbA family protein [Nostoc sp. 'Peltigera malacea cyanobiont' DB3992]|uniref:DsbA family protein n=1 Tax=Nostoc sp. 'Peltigera malacea cyanobiont' DB3992 TaxID=1206980 RepID=UPI000C045905|nr:DsbA family protein [Nostoc sp. 'Peltigera malacea cyanobiont' DB3992]PHM06350.1 disulfide bond formation protein DsbA [Nostoc sp. 'Peltigera malacea cyanobiont' DB3992]
MSFDRDRSLLFVPPSTQDNIKGVLNATVVLVMYGDYECSQSADVYRLIKVIGRQLSVSLGENYLCFIFRHFPQIEIHSHAQRAAETAEAAAVQGQFWPMHEMLFSHQQELGNGYLVEYANNLGLDISQFLQDISKKVYIARINEDIESGLNSGVTAAPALFINGIRYSVGVAQPRHRWKIEQLMAAIITANH